MLINGKKHLYFFICILFFILNSNLLLAKPKETKNEETGVYKKYVHPREYIFDLSDAKGKISLKVDPVSGKAYGNAEFTDLVKDQMPRKGDKVTFTYEGTSSKDVEAITAVVYDLSKGENIGNKTPEIFTTAVQKKQTFKKSFSLILKSDAEKNISLRLTATLPESKKKTDKVDLNFKKVTDSTDIKKEMEAEQAAIKKGLKIVRVKSNFTIVERKIEKLVEEKSDSIVEVPTPVASTENIDLSEEPLSVEAFEAKDNNEAVDIPEQVVEIEEAIEENIVEEIVEEVVLDDIEETLEENFEELPLEEKEELVEEDEIEPIQQKVVIKIEPVEVPEVSKIIIPDENNDKSYEPIIIKNKVSRYEKEYLQDYVVADEFETLESSDEEEILKIDNPDKTDKNGRTLLMIAAKKGDKNQIKLLLHSGADVNRVDKEGWNALMYSVRYQSDLSCVDLLLDADCEVKKKNKYGLSALVLASTYNDNPQILSRLLKFYSPSDKEVLKAFVIMLSESVNSEDVQYEKTKLFIDTSLPINAFYSGKTPLMYAAQYCSSTKIIRILLENNAHITARSTEGKTAYDYAVSNTKLEHDIVYWTLNKK